METKQTEIIDMTITRITLSAEMNEFQAEALAQFVKRIGWTDMRELASSEDEAFLIREAIDSIRLDLKEKGYAPR